MFFYTLQHASKHGLMGVWHILDSICQTLFQGFGKYSLNAYSQTLDRHE